MLFKQLREESMAEINFDQLHRGLEKAISAFPEEDQNLELQAQLVKLRLKELLEICFKLESESK